MALYKKDDLLEVLLTLEERIMRRLQVASLGQVITLNTATKECGVKLVPKDVELEEVEITCKYSQSVEDDISIGSIVVVLFLNKDTRNQLDLFEKNIDNDNILEKKNTHNEANGVVIDVFRKKVV